MPIFTVAQLERLFFALFEHHNLRRLTNGVTVLGARPEVVREAGAIAILDARGALGGFGNEPRDLQAGLSRIDSFLEKL
ncbi:MAG: hypothetical protein ACRD21_12065 [Vicinamibacteria bacterium]